MSSKPRSIQELGQLDEAQAVLHDFKSRKPDAPQIPIGLAHIARKRGDRVQSLALFREALLLDPNHPWAPIHIAEDLRELGQLDEAEAILQDFKSRKPDAPQIPIGLAHIARKRGDRIPSLALFREALLLDPNNLWVPIHIAEDLRELDQLDEAEAFIISSLDKNPTSGMLWNQLGIVYLHRDDSANAISSFQRGIENQPEHHSCYISLTNELTRDGLYDEATKVLGQALKLVVDKKHIELACVRILKSLGFYESSTVLAQDLAHRYPNDFSCTHLLVELLLCLGFTEAASECLGNFKPSNQNEAYQKLILQARLSLVLFDTDAALELVKAALELDAKQPSVHQLLTRIHLMRGDSASAGHSLDAAKQILIKSPSLRSKSAASGGLQTEIYKELRLNPYAAKDLVTLYDLPFEEKVSKIAAILQKEPHHAGSAIYLLVTLRQMDVWSAIKGPVLLNPISKIPRVILQFWDTQDIPADILQIMNSWKSANPGFEHLVFNDATALSFIERHFSSRVSKAFLMSNHAAMRSDLFRLAYLYARGGVYADADDLCRHTIQPWLNQGSELILLQEDIGSIGNNFMAASPRHPFVGAALDQVVANILDKQGDCIWFVSGPGALTTLFCQFYADSLKNRKSPNGVLIKDMYNMQAKISMHLPRSYKMDNRGWSSRKAQGVPIFNKAPLR